MSTTQKFTALGAGNGFPFCLMTDFDYTENYSFYTRVKFPGTSQHEKLKNATWFFWMLKRFSSFRIDYTMFYNDDTSESSFFLIKFDPSGQPAYFPNQADQDGLLSVYDPFKRICPFYVNSYKPLGEPLFETSLENYYDGRYGHLGIGYLWFHWSVDDDGDICLLYRLEGFLTGEDFSVVSSDPYSLEHNHIFVPLKVGPNASDVIDLKIYGLNFENTSDYCRVDSAVITSEFWEFA